MRNLDRCVHVSTKLNRSHLLIGKESIILPVLGRTEVDVQAGELQAVTVEDSMSMASLARQDGHAVFTGRDRLRGPA